MQKPKIYLLQEKNSDKNPSEISDKHIDIIRKENLIIIDNAMAKMREENNSFIKAFGREMLANLMFFLKEGNADLTDRLIASLKESNADLVNKIFEKMNNKWKNKIAKEINLALQDYKFKFKSKNNYSIFIY